MSVRWTQTAFDDLNAIYDAISSDKPRIAEQVLKTLLTQGQHLAVYPRLGRAGRLPETRELVIPRLPYILVYELTPSLITPKHDVVILRAIHGAMQWPPKNRPR